MAAGRGAGRPEAAAVLVAEILDAPGWEYVETRILGRYEDDLIAWAVRLLGGGRAPADAQREALVELLHQQYLRHSGAGCPSGRASNRPALA